MCVCLYEMEWKKRGKFAYIHWVNQMTGKLLTAYQIREKFEEKTEDAHSLWMTVHLPNSREIREMEWLKNEGTGDERREESLSDQGDAMIG